MLTIYCKSSSKKVTSTADPTNIILIDIEEQRKMC